MKNVRRFWKPAAVSLLLIGGLAIGGSGLLSQNDPLGLSLTATDQAADQVQVGSVHFGVKDGLLRFDSTWPATSGDDSLLSGISALRRGDTSWGFASFAAAVPRVYSCAASPVEWRTISAFAGNKGGQCFTASSGAGGSCSTASSCSISNDSCSTPSSTTPAGPVALGPEAGPTEPSEAGQEAAALAQGLIELTKEQVQPAVALVPAAAPAAPPRPRVAGVSFAASSSLLSGLLLLFGLLLLADLVRDHRTIQKQRKAGLCTGCDYDLRHHAATECPECGTPAPAPAPAPGSNANQETATASENHSALAAG